MGEPSEPDLSATRHEPSEMRGENPAERANRLARLREPGEWPTPTGPARRARPGEMPRAALTVRDAAVDPWRTLCWYAPAGAVPYTFERRAAGYLAAAIAYVRFAHPDGRCAVGVWICDQLAARGKAGAKEWTLGWSFDEGWRWRVGPLGVGTFPARITATALKAAVADPSWRAVPYAIEETAA